MNDKKKNNNSNTTYDLIQYNKEPNLLNVLNIQNIGIVRITIKKNNVFINVTDLLGKTILKFSSGLVQKKKNKRKLHSVVKFILNKISSFVRNNFDAIKIIIKGRGTKAFSYLKELKKKNLKIILFKNYLPFVHNGCRPPKKRRI